MSDHGARSALRLRISALEASLATAQERRAGGAEEHQRFEAIAHAIQRAREILDELDGAAIDHRRAILGGSWLKGLSDASFGVTRQGRSGVRFASGATLVPERKPEA